MLVEPPLLDAVLRGMLLSALGVLWVVVLVRVVGLRSFSKMTSFDFVTTVAMGSLLAGVGQATSWTALAQALAAMAALLFVQWAAAKLRRRWARFDDAVTNQPIVLMRDGRFCESALEATRVERGDVLAKLRGANVQGFGEVQAVVLETTGDISILHGREPVADGLLEGVRSPP